MTIFYTPSPSKNVHLQHTVFIINKFIKNNQCIIHYKAVYFLTLTIFNPIIYSVFDNDQKIKIIFSFLQIHSHLHKQIELQQVLSM